LTSAVRNVGVVEPRVVVKIPWAKLKPVLNSGNGGKNFSGEEKSEISKIELCSPSSLSTSECSPAAASEIEIAKRMKNWEEEKEAKFHLQVSVL
jgi:hypothetical protein